MENNFTKPSLILAVGMIVSFSIVGGFFLQSKNLENSLSVTGSARKKVVSDTVKWTGFYTRTAPSDSGLKQAYEQLEADRLSVVAFFKKNNIQTGNETFSPVSQTQPYIYNNNPEYVLSQTFEISSTEVEKLTSMAKNISELINKGVLISSGSLEYSYSKLSGLRVELLKDAMKDASQRAGQIAESGGKKLGSLKNASQGVVQVLSEGSQEVSDYGSYDTSKINKEVMVTVRAEFSLKK